MLIPKSIHWLAKCCESWLSSSKLHIQKIWGWYFFECRNIAEANPSPPLLPFPHTIAILGLSILQKLLTNSLDIHFPAFSINWIPFISKVFNDMRSNSFDCFWVSNFKMMKLKQMLLHILQYERCLSLLEYYLSQDGIHEPQELQNH